MQKGILYTSLVCLVIFVIAAGVATGMLIHDSYKERNAQLLLEQLQIGNRQQQQQQQRQLPSTATQQQEEEYEIGSPLLEFFADLLLRTMRKEKKLK